MNTQYNSSYIFSITLVATLGGLLFGYDTAVISGTVESLNTVFVAPQNLSESAANSLLGFCVASALIGCIIGGALGGYCSNRFGRRDSLKIAAVLFFISGVGSAWPELGFTSINPDNTVPIYLAGYVPEFVIYRIIGGIGVGLASMLSPMYIAELAPAHIRGKLVSFNQFAIIFGQLLVYCVNYFIARSGDHESAAVAFSLTDDANAIDTINKIKAKLAEDSKSFPADMTYRISMDNTDFIYASVKEVLQTFFEALLIVAMIVYIFLQNWRSTLIPMIAVPVSLFGTFGAFEVLGFTINTLTLFAMVLAIGLVVDDAIVVIEAVEYEMRYNNLPPKDATVAAMEKVQSPVIGVAIVLAAVFVPIAFLGGIMGILYKQFALTIAVSVLICGFVLDAGSLCRDAPSS